MALPKEIYELRANPGLFARELDRRGIALRVIDKYYPIIEAKSSVRVEYLYDIDSSFTPRSAVMIADNKYLAKKLLQGNGLAVLAGEAFNFEQKFDAISYAMELGFPVVVKPLVGSQGKQVYLNLRDIAEISNAIDQLYSTLGNVPFLVEKFRSGTEFRVFILIDGRCAVLKREPAGVIGDGVSTIKELAERESYRRLNPRTSCLFGILLDQSAEDFLKKSKRTFATVPALNEKVYVRQNANLFSGGMCFDFTDEIHPSIVEIAKKALASIPGLPYAGIDLLCDDGTAVQTADSYAILELNPLPSIGPHIAPPAGTPRNVAGWLADLIFPETKSVEQSI